MEKRVALITGAARGIGRAFADSLASAGIAVAILDIDDGEASRVAATLRERGLVAMSLFCDIRETDSVEGAVGEVRDAFGGIDILVNNAGLHGVDYHRSITELPIEEWTRLLDVNLVGSVRLCKACRVPMRERGGGIIINISSTSASPALNAYGVSKLAVHGLTTALASELAADGTRVYGIAPGLIGTESNLSQLSQEQVAQHCSKQLIKRLGEVEDVVAAMMFFCSEGASFVTGETLTVSGGLLLRN